MLEPVYIFLVTGLVCMSAALSAGALNKLPEEKRPVFMQDPSGHVRVMLLGNVGALTLIGALAYGFSRLDWWIPLSSVFVTFPVIHYLFMQRFIGDARNIHICGLLAVLSAPLLWYVW